MKSLKVQELDGSDRVFGVAMRPYLGRRSASLNRERDFQHLPAAARPPFRDLRRSREMPQGPICFRHRASGHSARSPAMSRSCPHRALSLDARPDPRQPDWEEFLSKPSPERARSFERIEPHQV